MNITYNPNEIESNHMTTNKHLIYLKLSAFIISLLFFTIQIQAQKNHNFLSAKESEPSNFEWMQGFPLSAHKVLHIWDGSFFEFPAIRWSVVHMREMLPTVNVSRGLDGFTPLEYELDKNIDELTFTPWDADKTMTWEESLWENYIDGMIILHKGKVIYESYFSELIETDAHAVMSLTKSSTGTLEYVVKLLNTISRTLQKIPDHSMH